MKHEHVGPPDRACDGCIIEAQQLIDEKARAWWRCFLIGLAILALAITGMVALSWRLSSEVSEPVQEDTR